MLDFGLENLVFGEIKDLFGHHAKDIQRVLAFLLGFSGVRANVGDKAIP